MNEVTDVLAAVTICLCAIAALSIAIGVLVTLWRERR